MLLQVHDELIFEIKSSEVEESISIIKKLWKKIIYNIRILAFL